MEISLLLMQQIAQLFLILIMGYAVVKVGLLKASDSWVASRSKNAVLTVRWPKDHAERASPFAIALSSSAVMLSA